MCTSLYSVYTSHIETNEENMFFLPNVMAAVTTVVVALVFIRQKLIAKRVQEKPHGGWRPGRAPNRDIDTVVAGNNSSSTTFSTILRSTRRLEVESHRSQRPKSNLDSVRCVQYTIACDLESWRLKISWKKERIMLESIQLQKIRRRLCIETTPPRHWYR